MVDKNIEFAALLCGIDEFFIKANKKSDFNKFLDENFNEYGLSSLIDSDIVRLAIRHSIPDIKKADDSSLVSVFSHIQIGDNEKLSDTYYIEPIELSLDSFENLKPRTTETSSNYEKLWSGFENEIKKLNNPKDFNSVLALLKKYTSTMPSKFANDISLFDNVKTNAALANCIKLYNEKSDDFDFSSDNQDIYLAINGDISGIQKFIFKLASPQDGQSGMSRRLRGRSLYLSLLPEAIASHIIRELGLTDANLLFCGGGRFTIIAPNIEEVKNKLSKIKSSINRFFINELNAELYFAMEFIECSGEDLADFGKVTTQLSNKLTEDKKHKFSDDLSELFRIKNKSEELSKFSNQSGEIDLCPVCGNIFKKNGNKKFCDDCIKHEQLGQSIVNAKYMAKVYLNNDYSIDEINDAFDYVFYLAKDEADYVKDAKIACTFLNDLSSMEDLVKFGSMDLIKLNDTNFLEEYEKYLKTDISFSFGFIGNTVPYYGYRPLYFEHLAKISRGADKLGVLKMDVDNLGKIFSQGFKSQEGQANISKISTLSSQLELFFSGFINNIASNYKVYRKIPEGYDSFFDKKPKRLQVQDSDESFNVYKLKYDYDDSSRSSIFREDFESNLTKQDKEILDKASIPTIYIDYSGGDDLLVIGPYDDVILFSQELRYQFSQWTCENPSITLSGGINIINPKFPIGKAIDLAEEYLESSKTSGKNKLTLFGEVVNWETDGYIKGFNEIFAFAQELEYYLQKGYVSNSFVYSLLYIWGLCYNKDFEKLNSTPDISDDKKWSYEQKDRAFNRKYMPLYVYKLRNVKRHVRNSLMEQRKLIPWVKIPVSWVSLRKR